MKKILLLAICIIVFSTIFAGCGADVTNSSPTASELEGDNRFFGTGNSYVINGDTYYEIVDRNTYNIYLMSSKAYGNDAFPLYDENGKIEKYERPFVK